MSATPTRERWATSPARKHDDVPMSTGIGLYIAYNNSVYRPSWNDDKPKKRDKFMPIESTF